MDFLEKNGPIAEFMGAIKEQWYPKAKQQTGIHYAYPPNEFPDNEKYHSDNLLKYHSDWNWLMPVVTKIESIYDEHHGYFGVYISSNSCHIHGTKFNKSIDDPEYGFVYFDEIVTHTKLEATYIAVTRFIEWYNKTYKKENE